MENCPSTNFAHGGLKESVVLGGRAIKVDLATNRKVGRVIVQKVVPSGLSVLNSNK